MKHKLIGLIAGALMSFCLVSLPASVQAQATSNWSTMHAGANPPTVESAQAQCVRSKVSPSECAEFAVQLHAGQCEETPVSDRTMYRFMNGATGTAWMLRKMLGGDTPALRCKLSTGRVLDWYHVSVTGPKACNNVGEPIITPPAPKPPKKRTFLIPRAPTVLWYEGLHVPLASCPTDGSHNHLKLPDTFLQIPRNPDAHTVFETPRRMN